MNASMILSVMFVVLFAIGLWVVLKGITTVFRLVAKKTGRAIVDTAKAPERRHRETLDKLDKVVEGVIRFSAAQAVAPTAREVVEMRNAPEPASVMNPNVDYDTPAYRRSGKVINFKDGGRTTRTRKKSSAPAAQTCAPPHAPGVEEASAVVNGDCTAGTTLF